MKDEKGFVVAHHYPAQVVDTLHTKATEAMNVALLSNAGCDIVQ